jgi:hypothetical protein
MVHLRYALASSSAPSQHASARTMDHRQRSGRRRSRSTALPRHDRAGLHIPNHRPTQTRTPQLRQVDTRADASRGTALGNARPCPRPRSPRESGRAPLTASHGRRLSPCAGRVQTEELANALATVRSCGPVVFIDDDGVIGCRAVVTTSAGWCGGSTRPVGANPDPAPRDLCSHPVHDGTEATSPRRVHRAAPAVRQST